MRIGNINKKIAGIISSLLKGDDFFIMEKKLSKIQKVTFRLDEETLKELEKEVKKHKRMNNSLFVYMVLRDYLNECKNGTQRPLD